MTLTLHDDDKTDSFAWAWCFVHPTCLRNKLLDTEMRMIICINHKVYINIYIVQGYDGNQSIVILVMFIVNFVTFAPFVKTCFCDFLC